MPKFRFTGSHPEDLADGRVLARGDIVNLDAEAQKHPHNQRLVDDGVLVDAETRRKSEKKED